MRDRMPGTELCTEKFGHTLELVTRLRDIVTRLCSGDIWWRRGLVLRGQSLGRDREARRWVTGLARPGKPRPRADSANFHRYWRIGQATNIRSIDRAGRFRRPKPLMSTGP
jgi:hypothetical protein